LLLDLLNGGAEAMNVQVIAGDGTVLAAHLNGKLARQQAWRRVESGEIPLTVFRAAKVHYPDGMVVGLEHY
jgi:hypothetical protein